MTAGGVKTKTFASLTPAKAFWARAATLSARRRTPGRSSQGLSRMKATPALCPREPKLKPAMAITDSMDSFSSARRWSEIRASTFLVISSVLPGGSATWAYMSPWSSCGRNPVGSRLKRMPSRTTSTA